MEDNEAMVSNIGKNVGLDKLDEVVKHDSGKPDLSLVPKAFLDATARALMYGEKKYSRGNYRKGMDSHRLIAACLRHITAWQWSEDNDAESGLSHLDHAAACLAMLIDLRSMGVKMDSGRMAAKGEP
jgi:hypothetical protein